MSVLDSHVAFFAILLRVLVQFEKVFLYSHLSSVGGPTVFVFDIFPTLRGLLCNSIRKKHSQFAKKYLAFVCLIRNLILGSSKLLGPKKGFLDVIFGCIFS